MEIKYFKDNASTVVINSPETSWAIFVYTDNGDLFLSSDWGLYQYSWRSFNGSFSDFLKTLEVGYIVGKLSTTTINQTRTTTKQTEMLTKLVREFLAFINSKREDITISYYKSLSNN